MDADQIVSLCFVGVMGVPTLKKSSNSQARVAALAKVYGFSLKTGANGEPCTVGDSWTLYTKLVTKGTLRLFVNAFYDVCALIHKVLVISNKSKLINCWSRSVVVEREFECPYIRYLPLEYESRLYSNYIVCCEAVGIHAWKSKGDPGVAPPSVERIGTYVRLSTLCFIKRDEYIVWVCDRIQKHVKTLVDDNKNSLWSVMMKKRFVCFYFRKGFEYMQIMERPITSYTSLKKGLPKPSTNGQQAISVPKAN
jgi:hypothetical protein